MGDGFTGAYCKVDGVDVEEELGGEEEEEGEAVDPCYLAEDHCSDWRVRYCSTKQRLK